MEKFIFVSGGVCSSLGKGIAASTLGALLEGRGLNIRMVKCDPYINVNAGTLHKNSCYFVNISGKIHHRAVDGVSQLPKGTP